MLKSLQSLPFAAWLPVQPMQALPSQNGVHLTFLRKGGHTGGIVFDVSEKLPVVLTATRNADNQVLSKAFSEKIVIQQVLGSYKENSSFTLDLVTTSTESEPPSQPQRQRNTKENA